jgi:hypothetical protein
MVVSFPLDGSRILGGDRCRWPDSVLGADEKEGREGEDGKPDMEGSGLGGMPCGTEGKASKTLLSNMRGPEVEDDEDVADVHEFGRASDGFRFKDGEIGLKGF